MLKARQADRNWQRERFAQLLRGKLRNGSGELKQAYIRLLLTEVLVNEEDVGISGPKAILAQCAAEGLDNPASAVLSFVQEWRARCDMDRHCDCWEIWVSDGK